MNRLLYLAARFARESHWRVGAIIWYNFIAYSVFNIVEAGIERILFGERFSHWLDPIFAGAFIAFALLQILACTERNRLITRK